MKQFFKDLFRISKDFAKMQWVSDKFPLKETDPRTEMKGANLEMFREIKKSDPRNHEFMQAMEAFIKDDETAVIKALLQHIYKHG